MTASARDLIGAIRAQQRRVDRAERDMEFEDAAEVERYSTMCAELRRRQKRLTNEDPAARRPPSAYVQPDVSERMKVAAWWARSAERARRRDER